MIANVAGMVSEVADVRSWNTLPSNIQISRISLPEGEYHYLMSRQIQRIGDSSRAGEIRINAGDITVLWLQQNSAVTYAYPPEALPVKKENPDEITSDVPAPTVVSEEASRHE
ncbi:hypothetical protein GP5015_890 [gamma proteobacterium HTCC5015]|nr:hypothetical protein GP5015_890 [gamma proteobacterium HTCC5015]